MFIDDLLKKYKVQPVGNGYIDCIVTMDNVIEFVEELTLNKIPVSCVSWWCHHTKENDEKYDYQYGLGGPRSKYHEGWFSEVPYVFGEGFTNNNEVLDYIFSGIKTDRFYSPCLVPGLWLGIFGEMPPHKDWRIRNQKEYLQDRVFVKTIFSSTPDLDHENCEFCWERIIDGDTCFSCCNGRYRVCEICFEDFKADFGWTITD